ncbi:MAG: hypothetical protein LBC83_07880 [Oscillospiraceae bacterium]|jgi:hypothetical protein|nr:hypothetical protein [Oscillospiraceae bacterium]
MGLFSQKTPEVFTFNISFRFVEDGSPGATFFTLPVSAGADCVAYPADCRPPREGWDFICFSPPSLCCVAHDTIVDVHYAKQQTITHTVYYLDPVGKTICPPQKIAHGGSASPPSVLPFGAEPTEAGEHCYRLPKELRFIGWSRSTARVLDDTFCVALTEQIPQAEVPIYSITFCDECGYPIETAPRMIKEGCAVIPPLYTPRKGEGWEHTGWNAPLACVSQDMVVRATVRQKEFSVRFLSESGADYGTATVRYGASAPLPRALPPLPEGCIARRWRGELDFVTEAREIHEELERETFFVAFYDRQGRELDEIIVPFGATAEIPPYEPEQGWNFLGWKAVTEVGREFLPAASEAGAWLRNVTGDIKLYAQCEPSVCRLQLLDLRNPVKPELIPMGGWSYGVVLSQSDLACLHLAQASTLPPFRFAVRGDAVLVLTEQGAKAFDMQMRAQPLAPVNLLPNAQAHRSEEAQEVKIRREA